MPPPTATHHLYRYQNKTQNVSQALSENKAIQQASSCSWTMYTQKEEEEEKNWNHQVQNHSARRKFSSFLLACSLFVFFMFISLSSFSSKMLCGQAIKRTRVPLSLAYCSEIYTKNVHTWAARNITWHYVSSYENVQNVNVLKNYSAVYSFMCFLKARPKKKRTKERNYLKVFLSIIIPLFFFDWTKFWICNTITVTAPNRGGQTVIACCLYVELIHHPHLLGEQKSPFAEWLHLDPLNSLLDVFQQGFVFWALVLLLVCVHIC